MSFEVEFRTPASLSTEPLTEVDYLSLNAALRAAARDPFDPAHSDPTRDVHVRRVDFGVNVIGCATITIDLPAKKIWVAAVLWTS